MSVLKEIIASAAFFAVLALFAKALVSAITGLVSKSKTKISTEKAEVLSKTETVGDGEFSGSGIRLGKKVYTAKFRTDEGELEFSVGESEWKLFEEGDEGFLTRRGDRFLSFERDGLIEGYEK